MDEALREKRNTTQNITNNQYQHVWITLGFGSTDGSKTGDYEECWKEGHFDRTETTDYGESAGDSERITRWVIPEAGGDWWRAIVLI